MQVSNGEAEAWLEGSSRSGQSRGEPSPQKRKQNENIEETSENEEALEGSEENEEYQEEEEEELDEEEEDVEEEEEEAEHSEEEAQEEHHDNGNQTERKEQETNRDKSPNKNSARLPQGSPVKRAYTTDKDNRKNSSRVPMSQRDKRTNDAKYNSDRAMFERLTGKSLSPTRHPEEFKVYYEKFCKEFLQKKEDELEKKRRQKEEDELAKLQHKPTLVSRPQSKPYVPLLERTPLLDARREKELEKIRKENEEKLQREFEAHTFAPKINPRSKNLASSPARERIIDHYMRSRLQFSQSPLPQRKEKDTFQPKINPNSRNIMAMKEEASRDVVDRLYHKADLGKAKKTELAKKLTPKFTPSLNKNTRKIAKQIEDNYNNAGKQQNEVKRVDKRKRSEIESEREEQEMKRDMAHLEQASDVELLDILKQFNSMLEQKNESPINLQQLSVLMQTYSEKKKENTMQDAENGYREETEEQEQEEEEQIEYEEEEDDYQSSQRRVNTEQPVRSYPSAAFDDASNPMANIEKNLMHIQGSLQDLKESGQRSTGSQKANHEGSSSHSPNKKAPSSKSSKTKKSKQGEGSRNSGINEEYSEEVSSKNSVGTNGVNEKSGQRSHRARTEKSEKSQRSSHVTPSKTDINNQGETKAPASTRSAKKEEDFSSPAVQKGKKKAQTTTKKVKKVKTCTDQPSDTQNKNKHSNEVQSLNEVFAHSVASNSKNSLEACNSNFEVQDYVEETMVQNVRQPQERVKGHTAQPSFGGYPNDNLHVVGQEDNNYRSNYPQDKERSKQSSSKKSVGSYEQIKDQGKGRSAQTLEARDKSDAYSDEEQGNYASQSNVSQKRGQGTQSNVSSKNKITEGKKAHQERTPEKRQSEVRSVTREEEKQDKKSSSANGKERSRKSVMQDDKKSQRSQQVVEQQEEENGRARSRKESRKVSFEMPSDSRKSSIYSQEQGRLATEPGKERNPSQRKSMLEPSRQNKEQVKGSQRKSMFEQGQYQNEKISSFATKNNKKLEQEHVDSDEDHPSVQREKVNLGDYVSFSANTLDQHTSFDEHQAPQDERRLLDTFESEESKTSGKQARLQTSPGKQRANFDVVTTETIQIEPQSAPRFAYAMDGTDKVITSASSSGLKAMAEKIVKKFKAYDAQIKQTAREYRLSVSPPRTASPSPDHYETGFMDSESKKESKVFKSVEKSGVSKTSKASRNSVAGSVTSVQSGVDKRFSKR